MVVRSWRKTYQKQKANRLTVGLLRIDHVRISYLALVAVLILRHVGILLDGNRAIDDRLK